MASTAQQLSARETKEEILRLVHQGYNSTEAIRSLGKSRKSLDYYRKSDPAWFEQLQEARGAAAAKRANPADPTGEWTGRKDCPDFPEFCEEYLGLKLFRHQLQWYDLLEGLSTECLNCAGRINREVEFRILDDGKVEDEPLATLDDVVCRACGTKGQWDPEIKPPRDLHPSQVFHRGNDGYEDRDDLIIVNTPPEHAKSTTITVAYTVWCLCKNPDDLIVIISKTQGKAKEFLKAVKDRLTHEKYKKLQQDFGPPEGFAANSGGWAADRIWLSSDIRDPDEKDPNVQALGIGGHIYGTRSNKIILDDCVDSTNVQQFAKQVEWISGHIYSRVGRNGRVLVVGTRIAAIDMYRELRNDNYYNGNPAPWTYLSQPAILEDNDDPEKVVTLWPRSNRPMQGDLVSRPDAEGMYPAWDGPAISKKRRSMTARTWALMYMQQEIEDDATFPLEALRACTNGNRTAGPLQQGNPYHRPAPHRGMAGLRIIAGLDPAVTKDTAAVVVGLDPETAKRYVLDVYAKPTKPDEIFDLIRAWTDRYRVQEWRIEKNAMNLMVTQNRAIRQWVNARGCTLSEHYTSDNKWDPVFGVASLGNLIQGWDKDPTRHSALLELPSPHNHVGTRKLIDQMSVWSPHSDPKVTPQDTVMALWFAEIKCREIADALFDQSHFENPWLTQADRENQVVIDLDALDPEWAL